MQHQQREEHAAQRDRDSTGALSVCSLSGRRGSTSKISVRESQGDFDLAWWTEGEEDRDVSSVVACEQIYCSSLSLDKL